MNWKFELDGVVIEEPIGFDSFAISVQRDEKWHGVFIEASASPLGFYGAAYTKIKTAKESYGIDASIIFKASVQCEGEITYTEAISGKLNFAQYQERCGNECIIRIPVEQNTCAMVFKNRFDQKVNIDSNIAFDKATLLTNYEGLGFNLPLATQVIPISADADVVPEGDVVALTGMSFFYNGNLVNHQNLLVRPSYGVVTDNSILQGYLDNPSNVFQPPGDDFLLTPQVLLEDNPGCIKSAFSYNIRLKGVISGTVTDVLQDNFITYWVCVDYWNGTGTHYGPGQTNGTGNATQLHRIQIAGPFNYFQGAIANVNFDQSFSGTVNLPVGWGIYAYIKVFHVFGNILSGNFVTMNLNFAFAKETSFLLTNIRECPPTNCDVYMVNETLGRITESLTDRCLTVKSDYYGRTDSDPYKSDLDGCGGLRVLTPGLKIRQATDKKFFASMEDVMNGLRAIDNIGMGMEPNTKTGTGEWLRIEQVKYFYKNAKILSLPFIPESTTDIEEKLIHSNILYGYNKWEIKSIKGIDEFNSYKERRTGIKSVDNELDITTDLIASGYVIENLRTSTLVNTGNTDNTYDNDIFVICIKRDLTPQVRETFFGVGTPGQFFFPIAQGQFLRVGSVVAISGTALNNGNFTITAIIDDGYAYYFTTTQATVIESFANATFTAVSGFFGARVVEQGITLNPANFYSPATAYNWRIRPLYNLMRWFKSIAQCYVNLSATTSKLFFTQGKGNYLAKGNISAADQCELENKAMAENDDLSKYDYVNIDDYTPLYRPETISFTYPMSVADYMAVKANPYGYIDVQCGNGDYEKAFIKSISYSPVKGEASYTLIKKWQ